MIENYLLEFLITAIVFTFVGRLQIRWKIESEMIKIYQKESLALITHTIDKLIEDGYLLTEEKNGQIELLKINEKK